MRLKTKVQVIACRSCQRVLKPAEVLETGGIIAPRHGRSTAEKQEFPSTYRMRCTFFFGVCDWIELSPKSNAGRPKKLKQESTS